MPWRTQRPDPYRVLLSEFLLQQTRVETIRERWPVLLRRFPTALALARAPLSRVLSAWAGLGYYARARNLHAAARIIVRRGSFPRTPEDLAELPGIGPYIAAAVASIAFDAPVLAIDGNVARVVARLAGISARPETARGRTALSAAGAGLVTARAGDVNQALMDLANAVCLPRGPRCGECPLRRFCATQGDALPPPRPATRVKNLRWERMAILHRGRILLARRGEGIWRGLFVPPEYDAARAKGLRSAGRILRATAVLTHRRVAIRLTPLRAKNARARRVGEVWASRADISSGGGPRRPVPAPFQRLLLRLDWSDA